MLFLCNKSVKFTTTTEKHKPIDYVECIVNLKRNENPLSRYKYFTLYLTNYDMSCVFSFFYLLGFFMRKRFYSLEKYDLRYKDILSLKYIKFVIQIKY